MSCDLNKEIAWIFTKRSHGIINGKYNSSIVWETEKVAPFFPLKDKNLYLECKLYHGVCYWEKDYVGEAKRNMSNKIWWTR